jgi:ecdysone 20-monooxygenase
MFIRYGDIICEEALWNIPIISVKDRDFIEKVLRNSGKYPIRPPNEVTANYRKSRPDRYTNTGLVNEYVLMNIDKIALMLFNFKYENSGL